MLAVAPNCITRSSLEEMLEALQRRDESEAQTPRDVPPALPRRAVPRSRLPSAKRRLPVAVSSEAGGSGESSAFCMKNGKMRGNGFRDEKDREMESGEWCYGAAASDEKRVKESAHDKVLQCTTEVQKGLDDRQHLQQLNEVALTFQSYVRGEIARKEYSALLTKKNQVKLEEAAIVQLQSVIRGWLARRHFSHLQKLMQPTHGKMESGISNSKVKNLPPDMLPLIVGVLEKRVLMAEESLELKEKENATFREQLQQYEARLKQSEAKMKSAEEMWQKQIASLQVDVEKRVERDGEDLKHGNNINGVARRKVSFEDEKVGGGWHMQRLKRMMKAWMKENKVRLRSSKTKIHSMGHAEAAHHTHARTWWGKKSKRS
ncbi:myosin-2-like [Salvia miltiorrhiza]|uniref:myosin-2-like n=1 Tax=Salvia miltiorrhiza TaxID=226208 RepID=UPI0025AC84F1|nr:myosin-2-like [Salvia miltiorrhiza]